ncbi:hypothetical protein [Nitrosopumilus sp.]|uniref:hypothetical protein n=1 Tax=Nitrosopumilus sp. TaxID=2024843 RepID=UPI00247C2A94|nr:hypothetical protein [Nitrosopumilus sp.]MCV0410759.1 hypothetical protein [Nitrosopumilus sp.]
MVISIKAPTFQIKPINPIFFEDLSQSQIVGRAVNDSSYHYQLQSSFDSMDKWITFFGKSYFQQLARPDVDYYHEHKANTSGKFNFKKELIDYFLRSFASKKEFLEIYNKLKQVFATIGKLILIELYFFVFIITLFSQQFGGNRDLPVAFA